MANSKSVAEDKDGKWVYRFKRSSYIRHPRITQDDTGEAVTRQEFRDECDVNVLMAKYQKSGVLPQGRGTPQYGDFASLPEFMDAQNMISVAKEAFASLPAAVRLRFGNDPAQFVAFAEDADNLPQMRKWGLAPPAAAEPEGIAPPPVSPPSG